MLSRKGLVKLIILVAALSLLLTASVAFAADRTATVTLNPNAAVATFGPSAGTTGSVTVVTVSGPNGGTTVSVTVDNTVANDTYELYVGRGKNSYRILGQVASFDGTGGPVTIEGIQMHKAPTNGQMFELVNVTAGQVVALSDPIRY